MLGPWTLGRRDKTTLKRIRDAEAALAKLKNGEHLRATDHKALRLLLEEAKVQCGYDRLVALEPKE